MKVLIATALATTLGFGWLGRTATETAPPETTSSVDDCCDVKDCVDACVDSCADDCDVTFECFPDGTCRIECTGPDGESCWAVFACDPVGGCELIDCGGDCCEQDGEGCPLLDCAEGGCATGGCDLGDTTGRDGSACEPATCSR